MDRFFVLCLLLVLLAAVPVYRMAQQAQAAQPVFFGLLFPQLLDEERFFAWFRDGVGEAVAL